MTTQFTFTSKPNLGTTHSLNCPKDAKNGFSRKFYIDIVIRKFSQLFFFDRKKIIFEKWKIFFWKTIIENFTKGNFQKNSNPYQKIFFSPFSVFFFIVQKKKFRPKKKLRFFFESLYRCKIFRRIHFSHPRSDLTSISKLNRQDKKIYTIL